MRAVQFAESRGELRIRRGWIMRPSSAYDAEGADKSAFGMGIPYCFLSTRRSTAHQRDLPEGDYTVTTAPREVVRAAKRPVDITSGAMGSRCTSPPPPPPPPWKPPVPCEKEGISVESVDSATRWSRDEATIPRASARRPPKSDWAARGHADGRFGGGIAARIRAGMRILERPVT